MQVEDKVRLFGQLASVELVIMAGTKDADSYFCPEGGVLIREDLPAQIFGLMTVIDSSDTWDHLELVSRRGNP